MPEPSQLRLIKRCLLFRKWDGAKLIPHITRGVYVLYKQKPAGSKQFSVVYIGVAGVGRNPKRGIHGRLKHHAERGSKKGKWGYYSAFEVHDNITRDEILELEGLLLHIFRHDPRIKLQNRQLGLRRLKKVSRVERWKQ